MLWSSTCWKTDDGRRTWGEDGPIDISDEGLVRRAQVGDVEAYGELAHRHRPAALRVATVVLGTADGADDVVQEAMERAWRSMARVEPPRAFRPWFLRIVANCARNDRRGRGRRARLAVRAGRAEATRAVTTPEEAAVTDEERRAVVRALNDLAPTDRLVVALRHFEHMSERDMAEVLGCPPGTVKSRLSRAMDRLRARLWELDREEVAGA
jgi:RNA polymerase sigma-70 factor (ECF subfamily)